MKIGVYPGSFDPFTIGHLDVLKNAAGLFDTVFVAVLNNNAKSPVFSVDDRVEMIDRMIETEGLTNVRSGSFSGLLVDYAKQIGAQYLIRGLRAITDFDYEFQIDAVNRHLNPDIRTVYFMANPAHSFLSSSSVREIGEMGGSIEGLVPACNYEYILERLARQK
ncbi:MAG: pantetheine-phosphate adenylyltransferase [Clostridia bacterium]|jgi:pantetheine-phosphate adenylyltransferase|nr:pantetheine-phosphate adenylyltransferase [Clostridia bacterium]